MSDTTGFMTEQEALAKFVREWGDLASGTRFLQVGSALTQAALANGGQIPAADVDGIITSVMEAPDGIAEPQKKPKLDKNGAPIPVSERPPTLVAALQKEKKGEELTEAEQAVIKAAPSSEIESLLGAITGSIPMQAMQWMYREGNLSGVGASNIDMVAMYEIGSQIFGKEAMTEILGQFDSSTGETWEMYQTRAMHELLSTGPNDMTLALVDSYAASIGHHSTQLKDNGIRVQELNRIADSYGWTYNEAKSVGLTARHHKLDPQMLARVYALAKSSNHPAIRDIEPWDDGRPRTEAEFRSSVNNKDRPPRAKKNMNPGEKDGEGHPLDQIMKPGLSTGSVGALFKRGLDALGTEIPAMVWIFDKDLARRLVDDPYTLTIEELKKVNEYVGGAENWSLERGGTATSANGANWILNRLSGARDVVKVDATGAKEAARTLAASWNLYGLTDDQLNRVVNEVAGGQLAALKAERGNPFNPAFRPAAVVNTPSPYATAAQQLRGSAAYQELFAHLGDGEAEEAYAGRFNQESQEMVGDTNLDLARAGMRTGSRNTVGQAALASGVGFESSKFQERLKSMGNAFKGMT